MSRSVRTGVPVARHELVALHPVDEFDSEIAIKRLLHKLVTIEPGVGWGWVGARGGARRVGKGGVNGLVRLGESAEWNEKAGQGCSEVGWGGVGWIGVVG